MKMPIDVLPVMIERVVDAEVCPWILECLLIDADGDEHRFIENEAILFAANLSSSTIYPQPAQLACVVLKRWTDETGRDLALISTTKPWGMESTTGATSFTVFGAQIVQLEQAPHFVVCQSGR